MNVLMRWLIRLVLLALGLVFVASLLVVMLVLVAVWGLRSLWRMLLGKPVAPMVFTQHMGRAKDAFEGVRERAEHRMGGKSPFRKPADVSDAQVKEPPAP
jgi:fatty acid desaturase